MTNVENASMAPALGMAATLRADGEELGRQWDLGIKSGRASDGEQVFARLRTGLDAKFCNGD
jgi:hypothetical protein